MGVGVEVGERRQDEQQEGESVAIAEEPGEREGRVVQMDGRERDGSRGEHHRGEGVPGRQAAGRAWPASQQVGAHGHEGQGDEVGDGVEVEGVSVLGVGIEGDTEPAESIHEVGPRRGG